MEIENKYKGLWSDLGLVEYGRSLLLQAALRERAAKPDAPGYVLFLEHPPTITLGYSLRGDEGPSSIRTPAAELLAEGISVVQVDRGGKATYHGPGQLVCYLIVSLRGLRLGVKRYVGKLENVVIKVLAELSLDADIDPSYPGVWAADSKVAALGIRVSDRVSSHGFALNVDPDLEAFRHIVPCGIPDRSVTSLSALGVCVPERNILTGLILKYLGEEFKIDLMNEQKDMIWKELEGGSGL